MDVEQRGELEELVDVLEDDFHIYVSITLLTEHLNLSSAVIGPRDVELPNLLSRKGVPMLKTLALFFRDSESHRAMYESVSLVTHKLGPDKYPHRLLRHDRVEEALEEDARVAYFDLALRIYLLSNPINHGGIRVYRDLSPS